MCNIKKWLYYTGNQLRNVIKLKYCWNGVNPSKPNKKLQEKPVCIITKNCFQIWMDLYILMFLLFIENVIMMMEVLHAIIDSFSILRKFLKIFFLIYPWLIRGLIQNYPYYMVSQRQPKRNEALHCSILNFLQFGL